MKWAWTSLRIAISVLYSLSLFYLIYRFGVIAGLTIFIIMTAIGIWTFVKGNKPQFQAISELAEDMAGKKKKKRVKQ